MTSKLVYLQRYASTDSEKKRSKKKKSSTSLRIVDEDHAWEQDAPKRAAIDDKWGFDGAHDEAPVVIADGEEIDLQDLPVIVNADEFQGETRKKEEVDVDLSPPRRSRGEAASKRKYSSDDSPPRRRKQEDDASPPRRRKQQEDDASPPRRPPSADEFAEDLKRKTAHNDLLRGAKAEDMGQNAETVYRDKKGRKLDMLNEMVRQQEIIEGKRKREAQEEYEWGTGRVQKEQKQSQQELLEKMKRKPFARREDDEDLEKMRRERVRAFDPIKSKVFQDDILFDDMSGSKKSKKKKKKSKKGDTKPKYAGPPAPPNRFNIQPGYRWDGVVRGTNWEEKLMMRQNMQSAASEDAYNPEIMSGKKRILCGVFADEIAKVLRTNEIPVLYLARNEDGKWLRWGEETRELLHRRRDYDYEELWNRSRPLYECFGHDFEPDKYDVPLVVELIDRRGICENKDDFDLADVYRATANVLNHSDDIKSLLRLIDAVAATPDDEAKPFIALESSFGLGKTQTAFTLMAFDDLDVFYIVTVSNSQ
ncbi:hypothetical protein Poli38472_003096 [Pythium oligandrum]|uniref:Uncharacterized protein n=1 Tax=Pythium oligandrum TaxID=41045 RepID=A0A8K1C5X1_PYTOL|nr:hypothetical protein Poli38472_003096 [Pythium oligandrum]|eukprot:TMW57171.1 hypothetical protein Poli38472_003096 [Pythium oligandrum]